MQEVFEKIIEKLEEEKSKVPVNRVLDDIIKDKPKELGQLMAYSESIKVVKEVAKEYNNGWISVEQDMPKEHDSMFAKLKDTDKWNNNMFEKSSNIVSVNIADEYGNSATTTAHTIDGRWSCDLLKINSSYKITHWQPLPEPIELEGIKDE